MNKIKISKVLSKKSFSRFCLAGIYVCLPLVVWNSDCFAQDIIVFKKHVHESRVVFRGTISNAMSDKVGASYVYYISGAISVADRLRMDSRVDFSSTGVCVVGGSGLRTGRDYLFISVEGPLIDTGGAFPSACKKMYYVRKPNPFAIEIAKSSVDGREVAILDSGYIAYPHLNTVRPEAIRNDYYGGDGQEIIFHSVVDLAEIVGYIKRIYDRADGENSRVEGAK